MTMKDQFEEASKKRDYRIEEEVYAYLQSFLKDNDRKIEGAKKRLTLTQETPEMEEKVMYCACVLWFVDNDIGYGRIIMCYFFSSISRLSRYMSSQCKLEKK